MEIIAIANQKGGVAKTTTAHALSSWLHLNGRKSLLIDLDPQGNATYTAGANTVGKTILDVIHGKAKATDAVQHTASGDIIAANNLLAGSDKEIRAADQLKKAVAGLDYDFIIIDTPPALGMLTINAFTAASRVIIPAQADIYSLQGIGELYSTIKAVQAKANPGLIIAGILLTRYNGRTTLSRNITELVEETAAQLSTKVYKTKIREGIATKEAQASKQSIFEYAPRSKPAQDYAAFIKELLKDMPSQPRKSPYKRFMDLIG